MVNYEALVFRPFKNQVMDAKVTNIHQVAGMVGMDSSKKATLLQHLYFLLPLTPSLRTVWLQCERWPLELQNFHIKAGK